MTAAPLMPKATALWLIENTMLTFDQIAEFCQIHILEVQTIADGESQVAMVPFDPLLNQQLCADEIKRCEEDSTASLKMQKTSNPLPDRKKVRKYTPVSKRSERPDAIAWTLRHYPQLDDKQIVRLLATTPKTVDAVRNKKHRNSAHIKPRCPVVMGLCKQTELDAALEVAEIRKTEKAEAAAANKKKS